MATVELIPPITTKPMEPGISEASAQRNPVLPSSQKGTPFVVPLDATQEFMSREEMPNPRPSQVLFGALRDPVLKIVTPIPLEVSIEHEHIIVTWAQAEEFGSGGSLTEAIEDFGASLRELYHRLHEDAPLGPDLAIVKKLIDEHIAPRRR